MDISDAVTRGKNPIGIIAWGPGNAIGIVAGGAFNAIGLVALAS